MKEKNTIISILLIILSCAFNLSCGNLFHSFSLSEAPPEQIIPRVVYTYPPDEAVDIELNKFIIASFNKKMNESTINSSTFILKKIETITDNNQTTTIETVIDGDILINNGDTILFTIKNSGKMDPNSNYSVYVSKDIKDTENLNPEAEYTWGYRTGDKEDTAPPEVVSVEPERFIFSVDDIIVRAVFNEDINPFSVNASEIVLMETEPDNYPVACTAGYDAPGKAVLLIPDNPLQESASYEVTLLSAEGITDLADNPMASDYTWGFRHLKTYKLPCLIPGLDLDCCDDSCK